METEKLFIAKRKNWRNYEKKDQWVIGVPMYIIGKHVMRLEDDEDMCIDTKEESFAEIKIAEIVEESIGEFTGFYDHTPWDELTKEERKQFLLERNHITDDRKTKKEWPGRRIWKNSIVACEENGKTKLGTVKFGIYGENKDAFGYYIEWDSEDESILKPDFGEWVNKIKVVGLSENYGV